MAQILSFCFLHCFKKSCVVLHNVLFLVVLKFWVCTFWLIFCFKTGCMGDERRQCFVCHLFDCHQHTFSLINNESSDVLFLNFCFQLENESHFFGQLTFIRTANSVCNGLFGAQTIICAWIDWCAWAAHTWLANWRLWSLKLKFKSEMSFFKLPLHGRPATWHFLWKRANSCHTTYVLFHVCKENNQAV